MKKLIMISLAILAALIGGFYALNAYIYHEKQGDGSQQVPVKGELEEGGEADPARMKLDMKEWVWVSALYNDEREVKPKQEGQFTLAFNVADKTFAATTDCNAFMGAYAIEGEGRIAFSRIASTKKACQGSQESEFRSILETTSGYHFTVRGQLILDLKYDSGSAIFR